MITECINTTEKDVSQEFRLKEKKKKKEMNNYLIKEIDHIN